MNTDADVVRLPAKDSALIDHFIKSGEFKSKSEFITYAVKKAVNEVILRELEEKSRAAPPMAEKDVDKLLTEIKDICNQHPILQDRIKALKDAGYDNINYVYVKQSKGLFTATHLDKNQIYRIQIGHTELQKGFPAAWCIDVSSIDVVDEVELPF